jgi:hypothetical protein
MFAVYEYRYMMVMPLTADVNLPLYGGMLAGYAGGPVCPRRN